MSAKNLLSFDDALARILAAATPLDAETRPLGEAVGHCLAEPIAARLTQPPFNSSAMDGYAVISDTVTPGTGLRVVGRSEAGNGFTGTLGPGEAVRIMTGAPVPETADTVVMQEDVAVDGDTITLAARPAPDQNIRRRGNDFADGAQLLEKGTRLTPAALSLCAAAGHGALPVTRRPRLALLMTGDELVPPGTLPGTDQIVASNGAGLMALFAPHVAETADMGIAGDDEAVLRDRLAAMLESDADVIITTGGASVGDRDFVKPVLAELGVTLDLWRIAMRPGKPLMFAKVGNKLFFGLPGNPISALTTATMLVVPALRALAGDPAPGPRLVTLPLAAPLGANGPRRHFSRASLVDTPEGLRIMPGSNSDSAHLSSFAVADALIVQMEHAAARPEGAPVQAHILGL